MNKEIFTSSYEELSKKYHNSLAWKLITKYLIGKYGCCQSCGITKNLLVHHMNYSNFPNDLESDLIILCSECHYYLHFPNKDEKKSKVIDEKIMNFKRGIKNIQNNELDILNYYKDILTEKIKNKNPELTSLCEICYNNEGEHSTTEIPLKDIFLFKKIRNGFFDIKHPSEFVTFNEYKTKIIICPTCYKELFNLKYEIIDITFNTLKIKRFFRAICDKNFNHLIQEEISKNKKSLKIKYEEIKRKRKNEGRQLKLGTKKIN